jgi:hypothetical protein
MSGQRRVEIERCLSGELRMEFDEQGRLVRAEAGGTSFAYDPARGIASVGNQYGTSTWSDGISRGEWSYGTWEQSTATPATLGEFRASALQMLRQRLMASVEGEIKEMCRTWLAYGIDHGVEVEALDAGVLEFCASTISYQRPEELVAFARRIDQGRRPGVWAAIMERIEVFSAKQQRQIRKELGLARPNPAKTSGKAPDTR